MSRPTPETKAAIVADRMAGMTERVVAEKYGVSKSTVGRAFNAYLAGGPAPDLRVKHSPEKRQKVLDDYHINGGSLKAVAARNGVSRHSLSSWLEEDDNDGSPGALTGGRWVVARGVKRWKPDSAA